VRNHERFVKPSGTRTLIGSVGGVTKCAYLQQRSCGFDVKGFFEASLCVELVIELLGVVGFVERNVVVAGDDDLVAVWQHTQKVRERAHIRWHTDVGEVASVNQDVAVGHAECHPGNGTQLVLFADRDVAQRHTVVPCVCVGDTNDAKGASRLGLRVVGRGLQAYNVGAHDSLLERGRGRRIARLRSTARSHGRQECAYLGRHIAAVGMAHTRVTMKEDHRE